MRGCSSGTVDGAPVEERRDACAVFNAKILPDAAAAAGQHGGRAALSCTDQGSYWQRKRPRLVLFAL